MTTRDFEDKILSLADRIYPMVARMLGDNGVAEDAMQEIFVKLWDRRKQIGRHPNIPGFVFLTARNYCLDQLKKRNLDIDSADFELKMLMSDTLENHIEWVELTDIIRDILKELPEKQREIMIMRDIDGFEFTEISVVTKLKVEYVRVLLSRARKQVRIKLKNIYSYE